MRFRILLSIALFCIAALNAPATVQLDLSTPRAAVESHLYFTTEPNVRAELAARTLDYRNIEPKTAQDLAVKLKKIMDGRGLFIKLESVPNLPDYIDSNTNENRYQPFAKYPEIYLEKVRGRWMYSSETVASINKLYEETFPFELDTFAKYVPEFGFYKIFGLSLWQWALLILFLAVVYVTGHLVRGALLLAADKLFGKFERWRAIALYIRPSSKSVALIFSAILGLYFIPMLQFPVRFAYVLLLIAKIIIPVAVTVTFFRLADFFADIINRLVTKKNAKLQTSLVPFIRTTMKAIVIILGVIYLLEALNVPIAPLLAGVSIGGLALALAAQETLKNLFGSVTILSDQPFEIGDWVKVDEKEGAVEKIGMRSTRLRTFSNSLVTIPNGKLADLTIDNVGKRVYRRFDPVINVVYGTRISIINAFIEDLRKLITEHPATKKDDYQVYIKELGDYSIRIMFNTLILATSWNEELEIKHKFISDILTLAEKYEIEIALPTRKLLFDEKAGNVNYLKSADIPGHNNFNKINNNSDSQT
ncbi:MAG: mechanosensitive ion channel domain-containing protein [Chloroflexota bacterium]